MLSYQSSHSKNCKSGILSNRIPIQKNPGTIGWIRRKVASCFFWTLSSDVDHQSKLMNLIWFKNCFFSRPSFRRVLFVLYVFETPLFISWSAYLEWILTAYQVQYINSTGLLSSIVCVRVYVRAYVSVFSVANRCRYISACLCSRICMYILSVYVYTCTSLHVRAYSRAHGPARIPARICIHVSFLYKDVFVFFVRMKVARWARQCEPYAPNCYNPKLLLMAQ